MKSPSARPTPHGAPTTAASPSSSERAARAGADLWADQGPAAVTFGAVALKSGLGKSLLSHHFATRDELLFDAATLLAERVCTEVERLLAAAAARSPDLRNPVDVAACLIEHLVCAPTRPGVALLEIAARAFAAADYRELLRSSLRRISKALSPHLENPQDASGPLMALVLGEVLDHCPQQVSPLGLMGLRQRVSWCLSAAPDADRDRGSFQSFVARARAVKRPSRAVRTELERSRILREVEETKRGRIVQAALDILAEKGADDLTHRQLARRAKLPLSATTYHFTSKMEILEATYQTILRRSVAESTRRAKVEFEHGPEGFLGLLAAMVDFYANDDRRNTLAHFHLALFACRMKNLASWASRAHDMEIETLRQRARLQSVEVGRNLAQAFLAAVGGLVLLRLLDLEVTP